MTRTLIEADWLPGFEGGADQYMIGLIAGLSRVADGTDEYIVHGPPEDPYWLRPWAANEFRFLARPPCRRSTFEQFKLALGPARAPLGRLWGAVTRRAMNTTHTVPVSDGFWESHADIVHQPYPLHFTRTTLPTILTVHDLQHRHFPQFFSAQHLAWREELYPVALQDSQAVIVLSEYGKRDLIEQYGVPAEKIFVIHNAPTTSVYAPVTPEFERRVRCKYRLPDRFLLYPALTYAHKNHERLLEALAVLRDDYKMKVDLICTGRRKLHWPKVQSRLKDLRLDSQVRFLGFVPPKDLRAIFRLAHWLIFPSLFEGAGIPLLEAFHEELPVLCSDIPVFREYGENAPIYFNPTSVTHVAKTIAAAFHSDDTRSICRQQGVARVANFDWTSVARLYRAIYRQVAAKAPTLEMGIRQDSLAAGVSQFS